MSSNATAGQRVALALVFVLRVPAVAQGGGCGGAPGNFARMPRSIRIRGESG
jgi:hypothetical protein